MTVDACPLCGCTNHTPDTQAPYSQTTYGVCEPDGYKLWVRCEGCGVLYDQRAMTPEQTDRYLRLRSEEGEPPAGQELHARLVREDRILGFLLAYLTIVEGPKSLLEFGSDWGLFAAVARFHGVRVRVVEPGQRRREYGERVWSATPLEEGESFEPGLICAFDVIEHMLNPVGWLKEITRRWPKHVLVLATPLLDHPYHLASVDWDPMWGVPDHRVYFSSETLRELLETFGYEILAMTLHESYLGSALVVATRE